MLRWSGARESQCGPERLRQQSLAFVIAGAFFSNKMVMHEGYVQPPYLGIVIIISFSKLR